MLSKGSEESKDEETPKSQTRLGKHPEGSGGLGRTREDSERLIKIEEIKGIKRARRIREISRRAGKTWKKDSNM